MPRHDMDGPADTSMMGIVHSALRRDLERARIVLARFFLLNFMGGPYQKRRAAMWDGTPAASVPSLSLAELDKRS